MGRTVLIILLSSILIFGIVSIQVNRSTSDAGTSSSNYYRNLYARNMANSMIEILRTKLFNDTSYRVKDFVSESIFGGKVIYKLIDTSINSKNLIKAIVISNYEGLIKSTEAYFSIESFSSGGVPLFLKYAVVSGKNLSLNGGVTITNAGNNLNANVHVNGNFSMNGNNSIDGFLTYTGNAWSNPPNALNTRIKPVQNPNNLPVHYQTQNLDIPAFEPNEIKSKATDIYFGNKIFNGNITLGTKENPKIIYVTGDLIINGSITGYGIFVSLGKTIVNGNVTLTSPDLKISNVGFYSNGDLTLNGNITVNAQIFSNGKVILNGNTKVYGNLVGRESVLMNGNVGIYYKPTDEVLTKPVWPVNSSGNIVQVKTLYVYE